VPEGYTDNVWKVTAPSTHTATNSSTGIVLDFTSWGIKVDEIKSMTVRYYVDEDCGAIRMAYDYTADSWIYITETDGGIKTTQWAETTLSKDFNKFGTNADGTLGKVVLSFRKGLTFYIDSITFTLNGRGEIPYETDGRGSQYTPTDFAIYTAEEAAAAGVPEGYTGHVMMLTGNATTGYGLDFTDWNIPFTLVESMTLRVYMPESILGGEVRLSDLSKAWLLRYAPVAADTNKWLDITIHADGTVSGGGGTTVGTVAKFHSMCGDVGQLLGEIDLGFRYPNGTTGAVTYVDSITFNLKEEKTVFEATTDLPTIIDEPQPLLNYISGNHGYETFDAYTAEQAAEAGVPEGYIGNVWKLTGVTNETGVVLDFTSWGIKVEDIETMTVRFYAGEGCGDIRLANSPYAGSWVSVGNAPKTEAWTTLTVDQSKCQLFANNADGTLGKVALCFRYGTTFYVDSITFTMKTAE